MRKKLFAILMSAMMMVTFMPAMAFATDPVATAEFAGNYYGQLIATCAGETAVIDLERTFGSNGMVTAAVPKTDGNDADSEATEAETIEKYFADRPGVYAYETQLKNALLAKATETKCFYDFNGAKFALTTTGASVVDLPASIQSSAASYYFSGSDAAGWTLSNGIIVLTKQNYVKDYNAAVPAYAALDLTSSNWTSEYKVAGYSSAVVDPQTCTITADFTATSGAVEIKNKSEITHTMTVGAGTAAIAFYVDGDTKTTAYSPVSGNTTLADFRNAYAKRYDGAEHSLVMKEIAGVTASYSKFNNKTGAWDAVSGITWKDATVVDAEYKVEITDSRSGVAVKTTKYVYVEVLPAYINVALCSDSEAGLVRYEGDVYTAMDFVEFTTDSYRTNAAKAIKADAEALKAFVEKYYDVTATPQKYDASKVNLKIALKTGVTTSDKDYVADSANWDITVDTTHGQTLVIKPATKDNEIDFIGAVKKIKAGKSKTIKAEALNGVAPTFKKLAGNSKIKVAANGKVTVKKGLKKGTYKVKVKATAAAAKGYKRVSATKVYKIKVVK